MSDTHTEDGQNGTQIASNNSRITQATDRLSQSLRTVANRLTEGSALHTLVSDIATVLSRPTDATESKEDTDADKEARQAAASRLWYSLYAASGPAVVLATRTMQGSSLPWTATTVGLSAGGSVVNHRASHNARNSKANLEASEGSGDRMMLYSLLGIGSLLVTKGSIPPEVNQTFADIFQVGAMWGGQIKLDAIQRQEELEEFTKKQG